MLLNMGDIIMIIIQASDLGSLIAFIIIYLKDKRWKRTEAAYQFYNEFDANKDCQLAMFMLDYGIEDAPFEFEYYFPKLSEKIIVHYSYDKLNEADDVNIKIFAGFKYYNIHSNKKQRFPYKFNALEVREREMK